MVGKVGVDFIANVESLMKAIDKVAAKLEGLAKLDTSVVVKLDDKVLKQLDRITKAVENLSDLGDEFKEVVTDVFDLLDGKIGNVSKQIEDQVGGSLKEVGSQVDDGITSLFDKVMRGLQGLSPLLMGQILGASILIERLVTGGFRLSSLLPDIFKNARSGVGIVQQFVQLFAEFSLTGLLDTTLSISNALLSITTVVAILTSGMRALTNLTLGFLQRRPETSLQRFTLLLETLNAGLNELSARSRIFIERLFFISSLLGSVSAIVVGLKLGFGALAGTITPWLSLAFVGLSGIRFLAVKIQDIVLRFRAAAGDGRAQTTLLLRSLRALYPIIEALADNAKPLAKIISEFAKGGIDKKIKAVVNQMNDGLKALKRVDDTLRQLMKMIDVSIGKVLAGMDRVVNKADALFQQIGRQGARDAIASIERVRTTAVRATKDVATGIEKLAPASEPAKKSLAELGASFLDFSRRAMNIAGRGAIAAAGGVLSLVLFGKSGNVIPLLNPLNLFRERATGNMREVGVQAEKTGEEVASAFSLENITTAISSFGSAFVKTFSVVVDKAGELGRIVWGVITDKTTIAAAFKAASLTLGSVAPLLAVSLGVVLTPLILRTTKNIVYAASKIAAETWREAWPTLRTKLIAPIGDLALFVPRQIKKLAVDTVPAVVNAGIARIAKGTIGFGTKIKEFFGVIPKSVETATKEASQILADNFTPALDVRKNLAEVDGQIAALKRRLIPQVKGVAGFARKEILWEVKELQDKLRTGVPADVRKKIEEQIKDLRLRLAKIKPGEALDFDVRKRLTAELEELSTKRELLVQDLRDVGRFAGDVLSQETRDRLIEKIRAEQRPVRKELFDTGVEMARAASSGLKAASDLIGAAIVAPFSRARTLTLMRSGFANLAKSVQATLSVAFRTAGGSIQLFTAALERLPGIFISIGKGIKAFWNDPIKAVGDAFVATYKLAGKSVDFFVRPFKAVTSAVAGAGKAISDKFMGLFKKEGTTRRTISGFFKGIVAESNAIGNAFKKNFGAGVIRTLLSPITLLGRGLSGIGKALGGKGGLTAATSQERVKVQYEEVAAAQKKSAEDLLAVQKAEKAAREAQLRITKLSTEEEELKVLQAKALIAASEDNEGALLELYAIWRNLSADAEALRNEFKNTASTTGSLADKFGRLASGEASQFDSLVFLNQKIAAIAPNFDHVRKTVVEFATKMGLSKEKQEQMLGNLAIAEAKLKEQFDSFNKTLDTVQVTTKNGGKSLRNVFLDWEKQKTGLPEFEAVTEDATRKVRALAEKIAADKTMETFAPLAEQAEQATAELAKFGKRAAISFLSGDQKAAFTKLTEEAKALTAAINFQQGIIDSENTTKEQKVRAEETLATLLEKRAAQEQHEANMAKAVSNAKEEEQKRLTQLVGSLTAQLTTMSDSVQLTETQQDTLRKYTASLREAETAFNNEVNAHEKLTEIAMLVEQGLLTNRGQMQRVNNALAQYTTSIEQATSGIEGVSRLSSLAASGAAGKDMQLLRNEEAKRAKEFLDSRQKELVSSRQVIAASKKTVESIGSVSDAQKKNAALTEELNILAEIQQKSAEQVAAEQMTQVSAVTKAEEAIKTQTQVVEQKTIPALKEVSDSGIKFSAAMIRAADSVNVVEKTMKKVAEQNERTPATAAIPEAAGKIRERKAGPLVSKDEVGQLRDVLGLMIKGATPSQILNTNLSKIRESLKNNPIFRVVGELSGVESAAQVAFKALAEMVHEPDKAIDDLNAGLKQFVQLLVQAEADPEKKTALTAQFSPEVIKRAFQIVGVMREMQSLITKMRIEGGSEAKKKIQQFDATALKALSSEIEAAFSAGGNYEEVADRVMATIREKLGGAVSTLRLTEAGQKFAQRIEQMMAEATEQIDPQGAGMHAKGIRLVEGLASGVVAGAPELAASTDKALDEVKRRLPGSLPKTGPLLTGILGMAKLGETLGQQMMKGKDDLVSATDKLLQPVADRFLHKSPPAFGPLNLAESSFSRLGQTIGQQMMRGVDALKGIVNNFLGQTFGGLVSETFLLGQNTAKAFSAGISKTSGIITLVLKKRLGQTLGGLAALPVNIAAAIAKAGVMVAAGIAGIAAAISSKLGPVISETLGKLQSLAIQSKRLDLEPDRLQKFSEAMGLLGAQSGDAENALQQLRQSIDSVLSGQAPEMAATFAAAGLSLQDLRNLKPDEIFLSIAEAANSAGDDIRTQQELLRLIGSDFSNMKGVILKGSEAIAKAFSQANKNPPLTPELMARAQKFSAFLTLFEQTMERIKIIIFEEVSPALEEIFDGINSQGVGGVEVILEYVRAIVRVAVMSIKTIVKFVRERYVEAKNGGDKFVQDLSVAVGVLLQGLWDTAKILLEQLIPLAAAAVDVLWAKFGGRSKVALLNLLTDIAAFIIKVGVGLGVVIDTLVLDAMKGGEKILSWLMWQFLKFVGGASSSLQNAVLSVLNWFVRQYNNTFAQLPGVEKITEVSGADAAVWEKAAENARDEYLKLNEEMQKTPTIFKRMGEAWEKLDKEVAKGVQDTKLLNEQFVAKNELEATFDAIKNKTKDATKEAARLLELLEQFDPQQAETLKALNEISPERLQKALRKALAEGKIKAGDIVEGQEEMARVAAETFSKLSGKMGEAFKAAFTKGFERVKTEAPELFALFDELGIKTQEEFNEVAGRIAEIRAQGALTNEELKKALSGVKRLDKNAESLAERFLLTRENARAFAEEFSGKLGILLPNLGRDATAVAHEFVVMRERLTEMAEQDPAILDAMAKRLGIQKATVEAITAELARREQVSSELAKQKLLLEQAQKALSLQQQFEDLSGAIRGPFSEARRQIDNIRLQMQQAVNELQSSFETMSTQELFAFANKMGVKTFARGTDKIKADLTEKVSSGFINGMNIAAGRPWGELLKENLINPLFDGLKSTIRGLIDGTLMESAKAAEEAAQVTGQKFSKALFVVADFGKKIFEAAFDKLLDQTFTLLTDTLTKSITESFASDAAEGAASGLGDVAGSAIGAAITAAIALGGLLLSRLQSEIKATKETVEDIVQSSEAIRGVVSGSTTVAIKEAEDAFRDAQRPITVRLDTIIGLMRQALGGATMPTIPLGAAGSTTLGP